MTRFLLRLEMFIAATFIKFAIYYKNISEMVEIGLDP